MKARAARDGFVHGGVQYGLCVRWCHYSAWGEQRKVRAAAQYFEDVDARDKCRALQRKYQELRHTTHPRSIDALREALLQDIVTGTWDAEGYKTCLVILRGRNHPAITQKLLHDAQRKGVAFTAPLTSEFMRACVNKRIDADLFEAVWTAAAQSGFVHRGMQYGLYVGLLLRQGRFQDAHRIYISLFSGGRKRRFADPKLLARLIAASPSVSLAWVMFNTMGREEAAASPENVPNNIPRHIMYDALLGARTTQTQRAVWSGASGYQDARRARSRAAARDLVARVLGTMRADGVRPGQGTFLAVLNHYKDHGDLDAVTDSLATFQRLRFVMEEKAYAIVIRTCSIATTRPNDRAARLAEAAYERAANDGHEYDRVITSAMMQVYAGCGDAVRAAGLLDRIGLVVKTHHLTALLSDAEAKYVHPLPPGAEEQEEAEAAAANEGLPPACPFFQEWVEDRQVETGRALAPPQTEAETDFEAVPDVSLAMVEAAGRSARQRGASRRAQMNASRQI